MCKGLSLNDSYWVVEEEDNGTFAKNNLYENPFSNVLAALAFTGYGSSLTGGAEHALPLRQAVADGVDPHGGGHLGCIILRIGLI